MGQGIRAAITAGIITRNDIYIQTKYTSISGQDPKNLPYDPHSDITTQVHTSISSSLHNLRPSSDDDESSEPYLDCLVLHSPLPTFTQTLEAWKALCTHHPHRLHSLGISNVTLPILRSLCEASPVRPTVVQNRFHAATGYDGPLRAFCREQGIVYQSFWTLTGNPGIVRSALVGELAGLVGVEREVAVYALVRALGIVVLNGTTSHMLSDLQGLAKVGAWKDEEGNRVVWNGFVAAFEGLVGGS